MLPTRGASSVGCSSRPSGPIPRCSAWRCWACSPLRSMTFTPTWDGKTTKPTVNRAAVAFSGGLDSSLGAKLLGEIYHAREIVPIPVDIGQGDEELQMAFSQARLLGFQPIVIDTKGEFANG